MCYQVQQNVNESDDHLLWQQRQTDFVCKGLSHIQTNQSDSCFNQIKILSQRWPSPYQLLFLNKNLISPTHLSFLCFPQVSRKRCRWLVFSWFAPVSQYFSISVCLFMCMHWLLILPVVFCIWVQMLTHSLASSSELCYPPAMFTFISLSFHCYLCILWFYSFVLCT